MMGQNSSIEWTDDTFNGWWGCFKISPGCANCYAETFAKRTGRNIWGPPQTTKRWRTKGPWEDIFRWDKGAKDEGVRRKVFCQSMSDFFEDHPQLPPWRKQALDIFGQLEWSDLLLLTKRPENVIPMLIEAGLDPEKWLAEHPYVWIGTSMETPAYKKRIEYLRQIPAAIRFLSLEPLLADLGQLDLTGIHWVIVGGESGPGARPMHPDWVRSIRDQCQAAGVAFFFKQWGEWAPDCLCLDKSICRQIPRPNPGKVGVMFRCGKKAAGRLLDGCEWSQFPK
jgi:protein gp37